MADGLCRSCRPLPLKRGSRSGRGRPLNILLQVKGRRQSDAQTIHNNVLFIPLGVGYQAAARLGLTVRRRRRPCSTKPQRTRRKRAQRAHVGFGSGCGVVAAGGAVGGHPERQSPRVRLRGLPRLPAPARPRRCRVQGRRRRRWGRAGAGVEAVEARRHGRLSSTISTGPLPPPLGKSRWATHARSVCLTLYAASLRTFAYLAFLLRDLNFHGRDRSLSTSTRGVTLPPLLTAGTAVAVPSTAAEAAAGGGAGPDGLLR